MTIRPSVPASVPASVRASVRVASTLVAAIALVAPAGRPAHGDPADDRHPLVVEVVGSDGRPAGDAAVTIVPAFPGKMRRPRKTYGVDEQPVVQVPAPAAAGRTDREGRVRFDGLATACYAVIVEPKVGARTVMRQGVAHGVPAAPLRIATPAGHTLSGVARRSDGRPVAGVTVRVASESARWFPIHAEHRESNVTDASGAWTITGLPPDTYDVWTSRPGIAPDRIATLDLLTSQTIDTPAPDGGVFRATVVAAEDGAPLAAAEVRIWDLTEGLLGPRLGVATTDAGGTCAIATGRASATVSLVAIRCAGRRPWVTSGLGLTIADGKSAAREFRIPKAAPLEGRVVGPDGPVAGARASFYLGGLTPWEGEVTDQVTVTDATGHFRFNHVFSETVDVRVTAAGFAPKAASIHRDAAGTPASVVRLEPAPGDGREVVRRVRGTARLPDGAPAPGAFVWDESDSTVAAADGSFAFETGSGSRIVWASFPGHDGISGGDGDDGVPRPLTIALVRRPAIRGNVKSATGANVTGARVFAIQAVGGKLDGRSPDWNSATGARVAANGSFDVALPVQLNGGGFGGGGGSIGEYVVAVQFPGHATAISAPIRIPVSTGAGAAATTPPEPPRIDLVLDAGAALTGRVVTHAGTPVRGAAITLLPGRAQDLDSLPWPPPCIAFSRALRTTTDATGAFTISHLPPGRWQVTATPVAGAPQSKRITLPSDTAPLELRLGE